MKKTGTFLRVIGGALLIFAMMSELEMFAALQIQKYFYLMMASGLLLYVVGLAMVKGKNSN